MSEKIDCYGATQRGALRESNQDHFLIADLRKSMQVHQSSLSMEDRSRLYGATQGQLLLVADGQSGDPQVGRGSTVAVDALSTYLLSSLPWYFRLEGKSKESFTRDLVEAVEHCQAEVQRMASISGEEDLEAALTVAYIIWPQVFLLHAGSSRCYLERGGQLAPLSQAGGGGFQAIVSQRGEPQSANIFAAAGELETGDSLLLCTDGVHRVLTQEHIEKRMQETTTAEETANHMLSDAQAAGGEDNMTVVVSCFGASDEILAKAEAADQQAGASVGPATNPQRDDPTAEGELAAV